MFDDKIVIAFTFLSLGFVKCQTCTKREVITELATETYYRTYRITYKGCWSMCTKTKISKMLDFRMVPKRAVRIRNICCDGYTDNSDVPWSIDCKPICVPTCKNGYCLSPGRCACNEGYEFDPISSHVCQPICSNGCHNGNCVAPNKCQCYSGYKQYNSTCQPFCLDLCSNGVCVAPDTCECLPGFRKSEDNVCRPYCFSGCPNGICKAPDECQCNSGYSQVNGTCQPVCRESCDNGICIAPDTCECLSGYGRSVSRACEPLCPGGCPNGTCVRPDVCECNLGWIKNVENDSCIPECKNPCENGICVAPDTCECLSGYRKSENNICQPYCNSGCSNGICKAPDECQCNIGYNQINGSCQPICTKPCNNGLCIAPDTCECFPGYGRSEVDLCVPLCFSGCPNGTCVRPGVCECNLGWIKNDDNDSCIPECKKSCGNGTCVAPDTCECLPGYDVDANHNYSFKPTICVPSCNNCINGTCIIPNVCSCEPPLTPKTLSINNCLNSSIKCAETVCIDDVSTTIPSTVDVTTEQTQRYKENSFGSETLWTVRTKDYDDHDVISEEVFTKKSYSVKATSGSEVTTKPYIDNNVPASKSNASVSGSNLRMTRDSPYFWIYVSVPLLMLIAILFIVTVLKRNSIAKWMKGGSYVVDDKVKDSTQTEDMSYQNILSKRKNEHS